MKTVGRKVAENLILLLVGAALTAAATRYAYEFRGYRAIGGEALIIPVLFVGRELISGMAVFIKHFLEG